ncbi:queuosine salvage family protein [Patescibacteria group bacterium]|nr:queuosine salvage family protein [Patescibacteria group bacterium]
MNIQTFQNDLGLEALCKKIKNRIPIPHNSKQEIEIRSATVWGVEYLKNALAKEGKSFCSFEVDWILWNKAQGIEMKKPYHLTKTVFY